jgi:hypothetical protein
MITFSDINSIAHYHYGHVNISGSHTHSFGTPVYTDQNAPRGMLYGIGGAIYTHPDTLTKKEPEMTILEQMRKERKEAIERQRIERVYAAYDEFNLDRLYDGTVLVFTWKPEGSDKSYCYAALRTDEKWYVTGRESPNGLDVEDFVAWLIGKDIEPDDLEVRAP